jgi:hypothetical protein
MVAIGCLFNAGWELAAAASGLFYGREIAQEARFQDDYIDSWFFWTWRKDGFFDWLVPMVGAFIFAATVGPMIPAVFG